MSTQAGKVKVLLIEDNEEHAQVLHALLHSRSEARFELSWSKTLAEGLEELKKHAVVGDRGRLELVLLDLTLPDSSGLESLNRIKLTVPQVPVIILTGLEDESLAVQALQRGAQDYLVKGQVDSRLLERSMSYALERARIQSELRKSHSELELRVRVRTAELSETNRKLNEEIAQRKEIEEALRETNRQLEQTAATLHETQQNIIQRERLHALGRMASGVAHDFNNSLAPILGFSELLLMKEETLADTDKVRGFLEMIHSAAEESARVVARLREFYRYREESDVFGPVDLNELIHGVVAMLEPSWKHQAQIAGTDISIVIEEQPLPPVMGSADQLREVLVNLISNSIQAITGKGVIRIRTFARNSKVYLQVTDNGCGMTGEVKDRCFEPFFSTRKEVGTGMGLGTVYGIVRRHDGEIQIESRVKEGTTVTVSLALNQSQPKPAETEPAKPTGPLRILLVEDDPMVRDIIEAYLAEDGHQVESAVNGREGLEKFSPDQFDLVLTDRAMPEMNGDKLAVEIKKISPKTPVTLLTGYSDMTGPNCAPKDVDFVIAKPFTIGTLREGIAKALSR